MDESARRGIEAMKQGEVLVSLIGGRAPQVSFLVRERSASIKYLGDTDVRIRGAFLPVGEVVVTAVVFSVGRHVTREYAAWVDYHAAQGRELFRALADGDYLSLYFYGDNARLERTFVTVNPLEEFFREAREKVGDLPPWDRNAFLKALAEVTARYPTPRELWCAVGEAT